MLKNERRMNMKKVVSVILCMLILVSMSVSAFAAAPAKATGLPDGYIGWYISGSVVHIRADANGTSLGLVYRYDTFNNYGLYNNGAVLGGESWREVEMTSGVNDELHGFVANRYTASQGF